MNLLESLKAAKPHLKRYVPEGSKTPYICYAIREAFIVRYGEHHLFVEGKVSSQLEDARKFIMKELVKLQCLAGTGTSSVFTDDCASKVLGVEVYISYENRQKARHLWLDSLIKELEDAQIPSHL